MIEDLLDAEVRRFIFTYDAFKGMVEELQPLREGILPLHANFTGRNEYRHGWILSFRPANGTDRTVDLYYPVTTTDRTKINTDDHHTPFMISQRAFDIQAAGVQGKSSL